MAGRPVRGPESLRRDCLGHFMNWTLMIAFGIPWLLLGARILESRLSAGAKRHRAVLPGMARPAERGRAGLPESRG